MPSRAGSVVSFSKSRTRTSAGPPWTGAVCAPGSGRQRLSRALTREPHDPHGEGAGKEPEKGERQGAPGPSPRLRRPAGTRHGGRRRCTLSTGRERTRVERRRARHFVVDGCREDRGQPGHQRCEALLRGRCAERRARCVCERVTHRGGARPSVFLVERERPIHDGRDRRRNVGGDILQASRWACGRVDEDLRWGRPIVNELAAHEREESRAGRPHIGLGVDVRRPRDRLLGSHVRGSPSGRPPQSPVRLPGPSRAPAQSRSPGPSRFRRASRAGSPA